MKTDFNISLINQDILEVYLISEGGERNLNLTWKMLSFEGKNMMLSLEFGESQDVSIDYTYD